MASFIYPNLQGVWEWLKTHLNDNTAVYYTIQAGNTTAAGYLGDASNPNKYTLTITGVPPNKLNSLIAWLQDCMYNLQPKTWTNKSQLQHYKESPSVSWKEVVKGVPAPKSAVERESEQYQRYIATHVPGYSESEKVKDKIISLINEMISAGESKYMDYIAALKEYVHWLDTGQVTPEQALNAYNRYLNLFKSYKPKTVTVTPVAPSYQQYSAWTALKPVETRTNAVSTEHTVTPTTSKTSTTTPAAPPAPQTTTTTPPSTPPSTSGILNTVMKIAVPVIGVVMLVEVVKHVRRMVSV